MTITLLPHHERALEAAINAGVIQSVEEFIDSAIAHLPSSAEATPYREASNLVELLHPLNGLLTNEEVDILFSRNVSRGRPIDLS